MTSPWVGGGRVSIGTATAETTNLKEHTMAILEDMGAHGDTGLVLPAALLTTTMPSMEETVAAGELVG